MLRSPNQRANQIRRSYKNEEFDWLFDFVTVTWKNNPYLLKVVLHPIFNFFFNEHQVKEKFILW